MNKFVKKVISGAQTGADRGGLRAAIALGIDHGGYVPAGRLSEDGHVPSEFNVFEIKETDYRVRTRMNVDEADVTLLFSKSGSLDGGTLFTRKYADERNKPWFSISFGTLETEEMTLSRTKTVKQLLKQLYEKYNRSLVINVAGNRESKCPGIESKVEKFMILCLKE